VIDIKGPSIDPPKVDINEPKISSINISGLRIGEGIDIKKPIDIPGADIKGPKIGEDIKPSSLDIHWPKIDSIILIYFKME